MMLNAKIPKIPEKPNLNHVKRVSKIEKLIIKRQNATIRKRVQRKALTQAFLFPLLEKFNHKTSKCYKQYKNAFYCSTIMEHRGSKISTTNLCKTRMCQSCSAIRTANLINGYGKQLEGDIKKKRAHFITLTTPTIHWSKAKGKYKELEVAFKALQYELKKDIRRWVSKKESTRSKAKMCVSEMPNGLRKMEFTINEKGQVHFHYHLIVVGSKRVAQFYKDKWLELNPKANEEAQDVQLADKGCFKELFKYIGKNYYTQTSPNGWKKKVRIPEGEEVLQAFNAAYEVTKGKRLLQPFGNLRKVSEEIENGDLKAQDLGDLAQKTYVWDRFAANYIDKSTGEILIDKVQLSKRVTRYLASDERVAPIYKI